VRLRNRWTKADFWVDGYLLRKPRDFRFVYKSLWSLAEDSACLEDDPLMWKVTAWASPEDDDIDVEFLRAVRDELIGDCKLLPYVARDSRFLFIPAMFRHEKPRNPQAPNLPLPPWIRWQENQKDHRKGRYILVREIPVSTSEDVEQPLYDARGTVPVLSCPELTCPEQSTEDGPDRHAPDQPPTGAGDVRGLIEETRRRLFGGDDAE
jgi:hypothetical protein